jgi:hypothetical protein
MAAPASASDATIRSILRAGNHFEALDLPKPYPNLVGEAAWDSSSDDVNRAFRKRSLHCHPDKSKHADAPRAFETLKKAKACLLSDLERDGYVREHVREQQLRWEGSWKSEAEAAQARARISSARGSSQQEHADTVAEAMRKRREKAEFGEWKKQRSEKLRAQSARRRADDEDAVAALMGSDDEDRGAGPAPADRGGASGAAGAGASRDLKKRPRFGF